MGLALSGSPRCLYSDYGTWDPAVNGKCPDGLANSGWCVPPGSPVLTNAGLTGNAINPVTYMGIRGELRFKFNDDRDVLLTQTEHGCAGCLLRSALLTETADILDLEHLMTDTRWQPLVDVLPDCLVLVDGKSLVRF
jgi:hypothetical protein